MSAHADKQTGTVTVRGDGIVGCSAALALARLGYPVVLESLARPAAGPKEDVRTYALNAASVALLQRIRVWDALAADAVCAVQDMFISGDAGSRLHFSAWEQGVGQLAWIVDAAALEAGLRQAVHYAPHITVRPVNTEETEHPLPPTRPDRLLILCEGRDSVAREALGVRFERRPYGHSALAARVVATQPHQGVASQWFRNPDVLALLPFDRPAAGASYGVVWSLPEEDARRWVQADAAEFERALEQASGGTCGALRLQGERRTWPLVLGHADRVHGPGWVLLGDCAHAVHPLAGQGLNLGLADVASLEGVLQAREPWREIGDERLLARHARQRAAPTKAMAGVTDALWHLFAHPHPAVRAIRNQGMTMVDHLGAIKRQLTRRALGLGVVAGLVCALVAGALVAPEDAWARGPAGGDAAASAAAEAAIRKALAERMPSLPKPDEISRSPMPGLWELRFGSELLYTDERGDFLVSGPIIETRSRRDLTAERLDKLNAIDFAQLPLKDAITIRQGSGARKLVIFSDPNCGFCKRYERDLLNLKDVTLYTFLYPILGKDSHEKSRNIWCSADPAKAWRDWMVDGRQPPVAMGKCDASALERNAALGQKHRIDSTPTSILSDGSRRPGALNTTDLERLLAQVKPPKS